MRVPHLTVRGLALVGLGSAVGATARLWLGTTLLANTLGTFALACLLTVLARPSGEPPVTSSGVPAATSRIERWRTDLQVFLGAGLCGGLTSYSALMAQALQSTSLPAAARQLALDFGCGVAAALLGIVLARACVRAYARGREHPPTRAHPRRGES